MKKYLLSLLALGTLATTANAVCNSTNCYNVTVTKVLAMDTGGVLIGTSGDEQQLNCTSPGTYFMTLKYGTDGQQVLYSTLLTAFATGKLVNIRIKEGTADCEIAFINIY